MSQTVQVANQYTPLEPLLLFQAIRGQDPLHINFDEISEALVRVPLITNDASFNQNRLSSTRLQSLYLNLIKDAIQVEADHKSVQDGLSNRRQTATPSPRTRRYRAASPAVPSIEEAAKHVHIYPDLITRLYTRYRDHIAEAIREEEDQILGIDQDVKDATIAAREGALAASQQVVEMEDAADTNIAEGKLDGELGVSKNTVTVGPVSEQVVALPQPSNNAVMPKSPSAPEDTAGLPAEIMPRPQAEPVETDTIAQPTIIPITSPDPTTQIIQVTAAPEEFPVILSQPTTSPPKPDDPMDDVQYTVKPARILPKPATIDTQIEKESSSPRRLRSAVTRGAITPIEPLIQEQPAKKTFNKPRRVVHKKPSDGADMNAVTNENLDNSMAFSPNQPANAITHIPSPIHPHAPRIAEQSPRLGQYTMSAGLQTPSQSSITSNVNKEALYHHEPIGAMIYGPIFRNSRPPSSRETPAQSPKSNENAFIPIQYRPPASPNATNVNRQDQLSQTQIQSPMNAHSNDQIRRPIRHSTGSGFKLPSFQLREIEANGGVDVPPPQQSPLSTSNQQHKQKSTVKALASLASASSGRQRASTLASLADSIPASLPDTPQDHHFQAPATVSHLPTTPLFKATKKPRRSSTWRQSMIEPLEIPTSPTRPDIEPMSPIRGDFDLNSTYSNSKREPEEIEPEKEREKGKESDKQEKEKESGEQEKRKATDEQEKRKESDEQTKRTTRGRPKRAREDTITATDAPAAKKGGRRRTRASSPVVASSGAEIEPENQGRQAVVEIVRRSRSRSMSVTSTRQEIPSTEVKTAVPQSTRTTRSKSIATKSGDDSVNKQQEVNQKEDTSFPIEDELLNIRTRSGTILSHAQLPGKQQQPSSDAIITDLVGPTGTEPITITNDNVAGGIAVHNTSTEDSPVNREEGNHSNEPEQIPEDTTITEDSKPITVPLNPSSSSRRQDQRTIYATCNFQRLSNVILEEVITHRHAVSFQRPVSERNASGYKDLIKRPQDLKSIRAAISAGSKAVNSLLKGQEKEKAKEREKEKEKENENQKLATSFSTTIPDSESEPPSQEIPNDEVTTKGKKWLSDALSASASEALYPPKGIVNAAQLEKELMRMFANAVMFNTGDTGMVSDAREMAGDVGGMLDHWRG